MSKILKIALVDPDERSRQELRRGLLVTPAVELEAECSRYEFFPGVLTQAAADVAMVAIDRDPAQAIAMIERLAADVPECVLLVVSSSNDGPLILRALRAGAREFLSLPLTPADVDTALARIRLQRFGTAVAAQEHCQVIAVAGASGGVGCTSLATNLACLLAEDANHTVAIMDLDLAVGDADVLLNLIPDYTLSDIIDVAPLDAQLLQKSLSQHPSGVHLLARPVELRDTVAVTEPPVQQIISILRHSFSHLIIDLSKSYTAIDLVALQAATRVLMVTQLDLSCLRNTVRLLASFDDVVGLSPKVQIAINRSGARTGQIGLKKAKETLGRTIDSLIPDDPRTLTAARNHGVPLATHAPKATITSALRDLAAQLAKPHAAEADSGQSPASRWSLFWPGTSKSKG